MIQLLIPSLLEIKSCGKKVHGSDLTKLNLFKLGGGSSPTSHLALHQVPVQEFIHTSFIIATNLKTVFLD